MVLKRYLNELDNEELESSRRRSGLTCSDLKLLRNIASEKLQSILEPFVRKTVREEVEKCFVVSSSSQRGVSSTNRNEERRGCMLRFVNQPPPKLFTGNKVEDMVGAPLQVEVVNLDNDNVDLASPLSSLQLEIVVLCSDYDAGQQEDPGENYFNSHVVLAREGKKPLITGDIHTFLKNGVGFIRNVCFTDNSRWTKSGKFRLGVRVLPRSSKGFKMREAVSDAFSVRDRRGEAYMKYPCPSLFDKVWRLKMIGKNGKFHNRLESIGVKTVKDFLQMLKENPSFLKETLRCGNSNRTWNKIIKHATTCLSRDKGQYKDRKIAPKAVCFFNHDTPVDTSRASSLSYCFHQVADDLGYTTENGINQVPADGAPIWSPANLQSEPFIHLTLPECHLDIPDLYPDQQGAEFPPFLSSASNSYGLHNQMEEDHLLNPALFGDPHQANGFFEGLSTAVVDEEFRRWLMDEPLEMPKQPTDHFTPADDTVLAETPNWLPNPPLLRQLSSSFNVPAFSSLVPNNARPRTAWLKLKAAVLCRIIIRQRRAARAKKGKSAIPNNVF